jgi:mRNA interferase MazF
MAYQAGDIAIAPFSYTDLTEGKFRPVQLIAALSNYEGDWLASMITSQIHQFTEGIDVKISSGDSDFAQTSLKTTSIIRVNRLMVISEEVMTGRIGSISKERHSQIISNLIGWLSKQKL